MILRRLAVTNVGPYNGRHDVDLSVEPSRPVILIHGENERGKTSFANAIRWCLYQRAKRRAGTILPSHALMNTEALDARVFNMSVMLAFDHGGVSHELERHAQATKRPTKDQDLQVTTNLRVGGNQVAADVIRDTIGGILHEDISRFFLFDGEMLNEYENLLSSADNGSQIVRQSIEEILGLPALKRAVRDLEDLRSKTERRQLQEVRARREHERLTQDALQKEDELASLVKDIQTNERQRTELEASRDQLREELAKFAEIQAEVRNLEQIEQERSSFLEEQVNEREACKALIRDAWWLPLEETIARHLAAAELLVEQRQAISAKRRQIENEIAQVELTMSAGTCSACGQPVRESGSPELIARLTHLRADLQSLGPREDDIERPFAIITQLRPFAVPGRIQQLSDKEASIRRLEIRIRRLNRRAEEVRERFQQHQRTEIQRVQRDYDLCVSHLQEVGRVHTLVSARHRDVRMSLERLRQQIRGLPDANPKLAGEAVLYNALRGLFEDAVGRFKDRVRKEVEVEASRIHHTLTAEPDYAGLRITDQYGLILVNSSGREIQRSAGSEQIVALSLIGALNHCATREGPIVMDTPFGRLDTEHRKNILKFAPSFGRQVILLVQSGEVDRTRDLSYLDGKIAREYQIVRDGASDRSLIVPVR
jgi:DNA sulfur modification protein DndD